MSDHEQYLNERYKQADNIRRMAERVAKRLGKFTPTDFLNPEHETVFTDGIIKIRDYESWLEIYERRYNAVFKIWYWEKVMSIGGLMAVWDSGGGAWLERLRALYIAIHFLTPVMETGDQITSNDKQWGKSWN